MYPQRRMVSQSLRLGLLVTLVVLALSACGGDEEQVSKPQSPTGGRAAALRPGVYRSEEFKPSLSFRVGEGWSNLPPEASDTLFIVQGETRGIGFVNPQEVYKPTKTGTPNVVEAPEDMVGWFQAASVPTNRQTRAGHGRRSQGRTVRRGRRRPAGRPLRRVWLRLRRPLQVKHWCLRFPKLKQIRCA